MIPNIQPLNVRLWLLYNCRKVIKTPPYSPDLNPIENVWHELEKRTRKHDISSKEQLKAVLTEEWNKTEHSYTKKLVESMPKRIKSVISAKGYPTKY
ncbi:hypothetical protein AVEN_131379-1 [Araneus ventricosus]|uniref:Tc1-like transposase DDE domain-containing protein n=1 Tax=Araneus ventricosus TaxID=182803 RepID=A0A4Y2UPC3_ARAVE|nr:hypothetical protein AVEN_248156-1 [Araneus ventricosus]GBO14004.1 hypothetical protein AVEN_250018-1 [Araneus ventricosus]GBO14006.1 hypothetical protein AVEN_115850-1 [Araneus ventricosus]GBO14007.1 hypothetical protein AVEN_131379-1 [Araneus ventricosus]